MSVVVPMASDAIARLSLGESAVRDAGEAPAAMCTLPFCMTED